ncbi:hypothetical protein AB0K00_17710 [Dactylosporangium sp. NPDC049525]|uniref:hypothetical protein n=1 Tax=Dactylosporangium sp. NPDC049525 TaxID=3154730 RepID=UPI00342B84D2
MVAFEGEDGLGDGADAFGAAADLGEDPPRLPGGEAAFAPGPRMLLTVRLRAPLCLLRQAD